VAAAEVKAKTQRLVLLRDRLLTGIVALCPEAVVNGELDRRVVGNLNISFPGTEGETLILLLDEAGIACSSGSACASGALDPSHVLSAIGVPKKRAIGSLRFSLGRASSGEDVDAVLQALPAIITSARKAA
jgi:cysteine desulfurase